MISNRNIRQKISEGEHLHQDFKFAINDSKKIARSLAAFANTDGGRLLIGVKDNGSIAGVRSDEEYHMVEAAAEMYCKPAVKFTVNEHDIDGKIVLEIEIKKDNVVLHSAPDKNNLDTIYIRSADENIQVNTIFIDAHYMRQSAEGIHFKISRPAKKLLHHLITHDTISFNGFCKLVRVRRNAAKRILTELVALQIIDMGFTSTGVLYHLRELPKGFE